MDMPPDKGMAMDKNTEASSSRAPNPAPTNHELKLGTSFDVRWAEENPLLGFQNFLIERLAYLPDKTRWSLKFTLDEQGWPLHLRSIDSANFQVDPGAPWDPEEHATLIILQNHGVEVEDIANLFFEGRTVGECKKMLGELTNNKATSHPAEDDQLDVSVAKPSAAISPSTSVATPAPTTPDRFKNRLLEVSSSATRESVSRGRSSTPFNDEKSWNEEDRDKIFKATQDGMTPKEIMTQFFPFRSLAAIQTRITIERKARGVPVTPTKWAFKDNELLLKLLDEGSSYEDIAANWITYRKPEQIAAHHRDLQRKGEADPLTTQVARAEEGEEVKEEVRVEEVEYQEEEEYGDQDIQIEEADDDSSYEEGKARAPRKTPKNSKARKAPASSNTSEEKPASIAVIRTRLLNSIDTGVLPAAKKTELRKAFNKSGWPTRFSSIEEYNAPELKKRALWAPQDVDAVLSIRSVMPNMSWKLITEKFFPGRTETGVRNQWHQNRSKDNK
ncbi:hypothetical protein N0V90_010594 [Kalmusia sp. IMI 367209]|nr:hypothetical protein N0V90_010594 [Kalmusia sp. IMI 367209]